MSREIRQIGTRTATLGEGAYWSNTRQALLWVDIKSRKIFQTHPESGKEFVWDLPTEIGFIVEEPGTDYFLTGMRKGIARIALVPDEPVATIEYLSRPEDEIVDNRFNDGQVDQFGNIWAGTMDDQEKQASGNWWHFSAGAIMSKLLSGFEVTNGPAFSPTGEYAYLTDSAKRIVFRVGYDRNGLTSKPELWKAFEERHGYPDGMNFDFDGLLWIAFWDGSCLRAFDENGETVAEIELPVRRPTKPVFSSNGSCYLTSAKIGIEDNGLNGGIFEICST